MKALQLLPSLDVGGVERGVIDLARAMKTRNEQMVVISSGGSLVTELQKIGVPHYTLPVHEKSLFSLSLISKIARIIREERIDIVHARSRVPAWLGWFAAKKTNTPFVTTCHGYYSKHLLSRVMGWGKRVIVISRVVGRHMIDDFGVPQDRICLVHRGIDLEEFQPGIRNEEQEGEVLRVINIGRLTPIKGHLEFLKAVHLLRKRIQRLEVWIVGSEGKGKTKYTEEIQKTIRHLGLEHCVKMLGTRRDIPSLLAQSDLLTLSTLVPEAFGRVLTEAGAVGIPVVATRVGGVLDVIDSGENGLLVTPGDIQEMADAMFEILSDREKARIYAKNLNEKVKREFSLTKMVDRTLNIYHEVLQQKKILIIKLGAMGDLILGTPSFRMIRKRFPDAKISLLVDKKWAPMISSCPHLDEVLPIHRQRLSKLAYLLRIAKQIRSEHFDMSVDLQNSKWTHLLAVFSRIPERFGFRRGRFGFLVNRHDQSFDLADAPVKHQFRILQKLGIMQLEESLELWPEPHSEAYVETLLKSRNVPENSPVIGLAMGSSAKWETKRWPLRYYEELAERLIQDMGCTILLVGSEEEKEYVKRFRVLSNSSCLNLVGKTNLPDLVSMIKRMKVLVTGDTAPLHVAAATKTPFVTLFGPTDPKRHVPPNTDSVVLAKHLPCQPCYKGQCYEKEHLACLQRIRVDDVYESVKRLMVL